MSFNVNIYLFVNDLEQFSVMKDSNFGFLFKLINLRGVAFLLASGHVPDFEDCQT